MAVNFDKSYTSPSEIVSILQERGLVIDNHEQAIQYLTHIGYYRFSAYLYPFLLQPWISKDISASRIFYDICILKWFVDIISPANDMKEHIKELLTNHPSVDIAAMGFPKNWEEEPLWR